jgi:hypothetical protein
VTGLKPPVVADTAYGDYSYDDLVRSMEFDEIAVREDDDDYQGDTYMLVRKGERWGLLIFGWGSCSGCDTLQDLNGYSRAEPDVDGIVELRDRMYNSIRWGTAAELRRYLLDKDWNLEWHGSQSAFRVFLAEAVRHLEQVA